jgi:hypothetical protein
MKRRRIGRPDFGAAFGMALAMWGDAMATIFDFVIWSLFEEMVFWIILARKDVE